MTNFNVGASAVSAVLDHVSWRQTRRMKFTAPVSMKGAAFEYAERDLQIQLDRDRSIYIFVLGDALGD